MKHGLSDKKIYPKLSIIICMTFICKKNTYIFCIHIVPHLLIVKFNFNLILINIILI